MSKASSVVASVTQQSWQRVPQSRTEYKERPEDMSSDGTTSWWPAAERRWHSIRFDSILVLCIYSRFQM